MRHLLIAVALLAVAGLDFIFVTFSPIPPAALTFAVLAFLIMLLLSIAAGSQVREAVNLTGSLGAWLGAGFVGFLIRIGLGTLLPLLLLLALSFVSELPGPSDTTDLAQTFAIFWLVAALALVGVALAFLWPRTGVFEAVIVGGLVIMARSFISLAMVGADRDALQLALFGQMVWPSVCLIGAWLGLTLREIVDCNLFFQRRDGTEAIDQPLAEEVDTTLVDAETPGRTDTSAIPPARPVSSQAMRPPVGNE